MSKELYESQIAKEAAKRFRMLCEYSFQVNEDNEEDAPNMEGNPQEGATDPGMADDPNMMGGDPGMGGADANGGAPGFNPQEGATDPGMADDPNMMSNDPGMADDPGMGTEPMQPEDEVIDIDELTQSQEQTENKVEDISITMEKGFEKLINIVGKLDKMIDASTTNMENIKKEIEKRNPTPMEKLNMRAANDSYPFNVKPDEYWKEKEATSNYRIGGEDEDDAVQYTITQNDIDSITDFNRIAQELNSSSFNQNLMNVFGLR